MTDMFSSPVGTTQKQPTYEFTKRKRWAELLLVELADAIVVVVSSDGAILYCGAAVKEILGWSEEELIDQDFFALMTRALFSRTSFLVSDAFTNQLKNRLIYTGAISKSLLGRKLNYISSFI